MKKKSSYSNWQKAEKRFENVGQGIYKFLSLLKSTGVNNDKEAVDRVISKIYPLTR
jgi:hypothetical protein